MGAGKAGEATKRNVGRGGKKVGGGKESGAAGQVSLKEAGDSAFQAVASLRLADKHKERKAALKWIVEQAYRSYYAHPQTFRPYAAGPRAFSIFSGPDSLAKNGGMEKAADEIIAVLTAP